MRISLSSLATPQFATAYSLSSLGVVDGSLSYLYSTIPLQHVISRSDTIPLTHLLRSYRPLRELSEPNTLLRAFDLTRPTSVPAITASQRLAQRSRNLAENPALLYGRLYLPRSRLEALAVKRVSPSTQVQLLAVSESELRNGGTMLGMVQYDKGRYGLEGLASTDGGLLGIRGLWNFGGDVSSRGPAPPLSPQTASDAVPNNANSTTSPDKERIYGRFSAGGELYYGTLNKSGGMSLGTRFATLPSHRGTPLTATLTVNPLMGNICASYAVVAREYCSLATKFDFNVYSYESDWAIGMELWSKRLLAGLVGVENLGTDEAVKQPKPRERSFQAKMEWRLDDPEPEEAPSPPDDKGSTGQDYHGVLKARLNQELKIGVLWEGRMKALLFSLGTSIDLNKMDQPFRTVGLEIQFSS